ncbi:HAD family hydrolase [soil metagenome]
MRNTTPILLYDIDGTLLKVQRDFIMSLISEQLSIFKVPKPDAKIKSFAGRTDRGIFMELIGDRPDAEDLFLQLKESYAKAMLQHLTPDYIDRFDDAAESVWEAVELDVPVGLCTGNFRDVAMKKVETAGLINVFKFGGFGGNHSDRNLLPGEADRQYRLLFKDSPEATRYVVIGDTPNDIRCAKHFGALSVAVTTGMFNHDELAVEEPDLILTSLQGTKTWLEKLGFNGL